MQTNTFKRLKHALLAFSLIFAATTLNIAQNKPLPTLRGTEAVERLKENGQYDSLMDAVKAAREKDGQTTGETNDLAVGQSAKFLASDGATNDLFGRRIAISGDTAVVGAPFEDTAPNTDNGAAYVFTRNGTAWTEQAKLLASDRATSENFGWSVAISGDTVVVGAYLEATAPTLSNGAVYVFTRIGTTWSEQAKLLASDRASFEFFGNSVAISGDTLVVGVDQEDTAPNTNNGAAYVFTRSGTTWTEQAKLLASDAAAGDFFGISIAISGETIVVGAYGKSTGSIFQHGAAYVFTRSGTMWSEQAKLLASDRATSDTFGNSVSISGETIVVGAQQESTSPNLANGAAYVFTRNGTTWTEQAKLLASDRAASENFGCSVVISGNIIVVGACFKDNAPNSDNGAAYVFTRSGATWTEESKLLASDATTGDRLGYSVAISGADIIVGAYFDDIGANADQGSVYAFRFLSGNWTQEAQKVASDGAAFETFGFSVSISGDTAIVGAYNDTVGSNLSQGSAYVFVRSGTVWTQQAKLVASDGAALDEFGFSVAISGDTAIVGSHRDDVLAGLGNEGSAYIFVRSGTVWTQQAKLTAADGATLDEFGYSVAISGDTAIVGAYADIVGMVRQGSAYIFIRSGTTWTLQQKITAADGVTDDHFGISVSISGNTAIIGAVDDDDAGTSSGSAYVFARSGTAWAQQAKLTASDAAAGDLFGNSVSISGDTAIVGAYQDDETFTEQGSAYVFVRSGTSWTQQAKIAASDAAAIDRFGLRVAISGDTAVIGAYLADGAGANTNQGAAYVFTRTGTSWAQTQKLTATGGAAGDQFGMSVGISGDKIIVGAPFSDASTSSPFNSGKTEDFVPSATDQGAVFMFINTPLAPTAANVSIGGRVFTPEGAGLRSAIVYLTKPDGTIVSTRTTTFGYYRFENLEAGQAYVVAVNSKLYTFTPQIVQANESLTDVDFTAFE